MTLEVLGGLVAGFVFHVYFVGGERGLSGRNLRLGEECLLRVFGRAFSG